MAGAILLHHIFLMLNFTSEKRGLKSVTSSLEKVFYFSCKEPILEMREMPLK